MDGSTDNAPQMRLNGVGEKLTEWENEPTLLSLKGDLESGKPAHDSQMRKIQRWNDLMAVTGSAKPKQVKGRSSVQPKLIRRQAEWRYSALSEPFLGTRNLFSVSPVTHEDTAAAKQNELVLNWQFRTKLDKVKFIDDFVRATVDEGTCVIRTGWLRVTKKVPKTVPKWGFYEPQSAEELQALEAAFDLKGENPREYDETVDDALKAAVDYLEENQVPVVAVMEGEETIEVEEVIENRPDLKVFNPQNVQIDPSCGGDLNKALYAIFSFETNKSELQKQGRYKNLDKVNWESNGPNTSQDHATSTPDNHQFKDAARKKVVAHEYWGFYDIHGTGELVPIVATWIGDTLVRMEENPFPDGKLPIVISTYLPVKRELYGEPDAELLEDNQAILGALTRGMIDLLGRSANSQQGFAKGMLDPLNRRRFESGQDYEFNPNQNPQNNHIQHKYPELPQSALAMLGIQNQDAEALTGVKSFSGGMSGEAYGEVAAGIRGVLDAASKREMAILRRLAKAIIEVGRKIIAMNAVFLSEEEIVRVSNEEFVSVAREELAGDFDLEVDISTAEVDSQKASDLAFMLQTVGPNMGLEMTKIILAEIAELKRMPELAQRIRNFQPEVSEHEKRMQELEARKAEKEVEKLDSEILKNKAAAARDMAERDIKDLDFLEQESGTKHVRDMQQTKAQSRGNQEHEIVKALTKERDPEKQAPDIEAAVGFTEFSDRRGEGPSSGL